MISFLEDKINNLNNEIISKKTLYLDRKRQFEKVDEDLKILEDKYALYKKTFEFLDQFSSSLRESVSKKIENLVTNVLQNILEDNRYEFKIDFNTRKNGVEAVFLLYDRLNNQKIDIINSSGGGIADIVSTILLFAFLEIYNSKSDFIVLDEVGKHISADKREEFFKLLKNLTLEYNKQIIYVSHQQEVLNIADNIIKLKTGQGGFVQIEGCV
jgi:DNA repair ATPase RecN